MLSLVLYAAMVMTPLPCDCGCQETGVCKCEVCVGHDFRWYPCLSDGSYSLFDGERYVGSLYWKFGGIRMYYDFTRSKWYKDPPIAGPKKPCTVVLEPVPACST